MLSQVFASVPNANTDSKHVTSLSEIETADSLKFKQPQNSLRIVIEVLRQAKESKNKELIGRCELIQGEVYYHYEAYDLAITHLKNALDVFKGLSNPSKVFDTYFVLSRCCYSSGAIELAYKYARSAMEIATELKDKNRYARALLSSGSAQSQLSEFKNDSTLNIFYKTLALSEEIGNIEVESISTFNISVIHKNKKDYDAALYWTKIFSSKFMNDDRVDIGLKSAHYNIIATIYIEKGMVEKAEEYCKISEDYIYGNEGLIDKLSPRERLARNRYRLDSLKGYFESALKHHQRFMALRDSISKESFNTKLANYEVLFQVNDMESEMKQLETENELKDLKIDQRTGLVYTALVIMVLLFVFFVTRNKLMRQITRQNNVLVEQKEELQTANEQIHAQSLKLAERNEELETMIEEIKTMQQQLIQSEKMASVGTLISGVMHEINNPLNFILGGLNVLKDRLEGKNIIDEEFQVPINMVWEGAKRTEQIVKSLKYCGGGMKDVLQKVQVREIIENVLTLIKPKIKHDVKIVEKYSCAKEVNIYPEKISQIIVSILDNAVFAAHHSESTEKEIVISAECKRNVLVIDIFNTGSRIPVSDHNKIFDPFYTTKAPDMGSGLGLSIAYQFAKDHEGSIHVTNRDHGVSFVVEIPIS